MKNLIAFFVSWVVLSSTNVQAADHIIYSDGTTNWGVWGSMNRCPVDAFVVSWMQKTERDQGIWVDDTAQNGIQMHCAYPNNTGSIITRITSTVGPFGGWGADITCYPNFVSGFNLRVESNQGSSDDTATNNFRGRCSSGEDRDGDGETWGSWRTHRDCDYRHAVCGVQTQVEPDQGDDDDTAMNNVNLFCCQLPNMAETCVPKQKYREAVICDNSGSKTDSECTISYEVGVGYVPGKEEFAKGWEGAGFTLNDAVKDLPKAFKAHMKGNEKLSFTESVFLEGTVESVKVNVPAGFISTFSYLSAECDHYSVASRKIQRVDTSKDGKVEATTYFYI